MNKTILGSLLVLVVLSASVYYVLGDDVKILIENTRTKYYVQNDGWVLAATEYVNLYDGTTKMRAKSRELTSWDDSNYAYTQRTSTWKDDIKTIQTYTFSKASTDVEQFPLKNEFQCFNCEGKIVHYEIRDILYDGETKEIESPFAFGNRMKVEWQAGAYYAKVFQQSVSDKIIIKYRPQDSDETYSVRLFDPLPYSSNESWLAIPDTNFTLNYTSGITDFEVKAYNQTWINCTTSDSLTVDINKSKATVALWFSNSTTSWTSLIKSDGDIYINGSLDAGWTWLPYFVSEDIITFCKTDSSTFINVSIDAIRVYEQALNSTQVLEVHNYGR